MTKEEKKYQDKLSILISEGMGHLFDLHDRKIIFKAMESYKDQETAELQKKCEGLVKALEEVRDTLLLCTLIDKTNTAQKSFDVVEKSLSDYEKSK